MVRKKDNTLDIQLVADNSELMSRLLFLFQSRTGEVLPKIIKIGDSGEYFLYDKVMQKLKNLEKEFGNLNLESVEYSYRKEENMEELKIPYLEIFSYENESIYVLVSEIHKSKKRNDQLLCARVSILYKNDESYKKIENEFININEYIYENEDDTGITVINMIVADDNGYYLTTIDLNVSNIDPSLFDYIYGNNFTEGFSNPLLKRLDPENVNKGLILLHGLPGTGKTTYIKYLIHECEKRYNRESIFISGDFFAHSINDPSFTNFIVENLMELDNPPLLIVEDAEKILASRENNFDKGISTLLSMTDGILNDIMRFDIIATFNWELDKIDDALQRQGRLIARKEFKAMNEENVKQLCSMINIEYSDELKKKIKANNRNNSITVSDIFTIKRENEILLHDYSEKEKEKIGF